MLIPLLTIFLLLSLTGLILAIRFRSEVTLLVLDTGWWLAAIVSCVFVVQAWLGRAYSENWASIGFMYISLPIILSTGLLITVQLYAMRQWRNGNPFEEAR